MSDEAAESTISGATTAEKATETPHWVIVEVFGYRRHVGIVSREDRHGTVMWRIDVPRDDAAASATYYYDGLAIFSEIPTSEEVGPQLLMQLPYLASEDDDLPF